MAYRHRNRRSNRASQVQLPDGAEVAAIHVRYFVSVGLANEQVKPKTPEGRAAFAVKFGKPEYRREAWLQVRDDLRELVPAWVYEAMDENFTHGPALHFTQAFDLDTRRRMRDAVTSN